MLDLNNYSNSQVCHAIDEWIHSELDRELLKKRLIDGYSFPMLAEIARQMLNNPDYTERQTRRRYDNAMLV